MLKAVSTCQDIHDNLQSTEPALQVLVEGFKSYKDQTRTEPFSNKLNTIGMSHLVEHSSRPSDSMGKVSWLNKL